MDGRRRWPGGASGRRQYTGSGWERCAADVGAESRTLSSSLWSRRAIRASTIPSEHVVWPSSSISKLPTSGQVRGQVRSARAGNGVRVRQGRAKGSSGGPSMSAVAVDVKRGRML